MSEIDLEFTASRVNVTADTRSFVSVRAENVTDTDVLDQIDIEDAIAHYSMGNLLDSIGKDKAKEYFSLTEESAK